MADSPLGDFGIWVERHRLVPETAAVIEAAGFDTLWVGGSPPPGLRGIRALLQATRRLTVATSVISIAAAPADRLADVFGRTEEQFPGRLLLGIGAGGRGVDAMRRYVRRLDERGVPRARVLLGVRGPRGLHVARTVAAGAHPFLVTPEHTRFARRELGPRPLLAPEQRVSLDAGGWGRAVGEVRSELRYRPSRTVLERLGYAPDLVRGATESLMKDLIVSGRPHEVRARLEAHLRAGADHVAVHVVPDSASTGPAVFAELGRLLQPS